MTSSNKHGMPGVIALALAHYRRRVLELEEPGATSESVDATILAEARAQGGVLGEGETINLSFWSQRLGIRRDVLEALALLLRNHEQKPPPDQVPAVVPSPLPPIMTPAPVATRNPRVDPAHGALRFCFPDAETMKRCLLEIGLEEAQGARDFDLSMVRAHAHMDGLELTLRLDTRSLDDTMRVLAGRELLLFRQ